MPAAPLGLRWCRRMRQIATGRRMSPGLPGCCHRLPCTGLSRWVLGGPRTARRPGSAATQLTLGCWHARSRASPCPALLRRACTSLCPHRLRRVVLHRRWTRRLWCGGMPLMRWRRCLATHPHRSASAPACRRCRSRRPWWSSASGRQRRSSGRVRVMGLGQGLVRRLAPSQTRRLSPQRRLRHRLPPDHPRRPRRLVQAPELLHPFHPGRLRLRLPS